jgi:hypothetical protein
VPGSGFERGSHHSDPIIGFQGVSQRRFRRGLSISEQASQVARPPEREGKGSSVAGSSVQRQPNMRMKLTARGGRLKRKRAFLSAAATGCSLCAIR